jgi:penicillin amidase
LATEYGRIFQRLSDLPWFGRGGSFGSNNWAVDGTKTRSGKPMICSDPHLGFKIPSIWYTAHLSVKNQNVAGVTFPGSPTVVIGHNDSIAWGITNMQADAVDFYIETLDPKDPNRYLHQGQSQEIKRTVETIPVRGADPHKMVVESTVHGPIIDKQSQVVSLCWTGLGMTTDGIAFWQIARARDLPGFLKGLDHLQVPALNMVYGDIHGNIAMHCCGRLPIRARGQGRVPMDGSTGENDWQGWIPREQLPLSINPDEHFVASANGRPHPLGYPHYLGWMWDPSYRTRRIKQLLGEADDLNLEKMKAIQFDHFDHAAASFLPSMLPALEKLLADPTTQKELSATIHAIKQWDYLATPDSIGPIIWLRWLEHYRQQVWGDEWQHFGVEMQSGSWGFCGDNGREPMLEVLEFLTRQMPQSQWFDDRRTAEREDRDAVLRSSFVAAVDSLKQQYGADTAIWSWKNINVLKIQSLSGQPELNIDGGPVVGTAYTLNPGGDGGHVGGGASWRMIVDFGDPASSLGVYPGGQSEQPTGPHYADQVPLWVSGEYTKLNMVGSADALPAEAKKRSLKFK